MIPATAGEMAAELLNVQRNREPVVLVKTPCAVDIPVAGGHSGRAEHGGGCRKAGKDAQERWSGQDPWIDAHELPPVRMLRRARLLRRKMQDGLASQRGAILDGCRRGANVDLPAAVEQSGRACVGLDSRRTPELVVVEPHAPTEVVCLRRPSCPVKPAAELLRLPDDRPRRSRIVPTEGGLDP